MLTMAEWHNTHCGEEKRIFEVTGSTSEATLDDIYISRYSTPLPDVDDEKIERYVREIFKEFIPGSSLLIVGSGHPDLAIKIKKACKNIKKIGCVDRINEASTGLEDNDINFYKLDILEHSIPREYDYVFSSHTLEHFTRSELLGKVLPRMRDAALKSVYAVVPFEEAWAGEPTHRCRFYRGDELFCSSRKYKLIHHNKELVLKF